MSNKRELQGFRGLLWGYKRPPPIFGQRPNFYIFLGPFPYSVKSQTVPQTFELYCKLPEQILGTRPSNFVEYFKFEWEV